MATPTGPLSVTLRIPVAWGDMDALSHVNNTVYLRWFESARIAWWEQLGLGEPVGAGHTGPILARTTIDYRRPVSYPDTIELTVATQRVGGKSMVLAYKVYSTAQGGELVAEGETVLVLFDYKRNQTLTISDELRLRMEGGGSAPSPEPK